MSPSVGRDARKHARAALELPVTVSDASNRVAGGIRFDAADVSTGGELLALQFELPDGGGPIRTAGRVTRVSRGEAKEVAGMGVEFVDLLPQDRAAIEGRLRR